MSGKRTQILALAGLIAVVTAVYGAHFDNDFHFDDSHAIQSNPHITTLANAGRFFVDPTTFSSSISHQGYRPLLTLEFAIDYAIGGGLRTVPFHIHSFLLFALLILCVYGLIAKYLSAPDGPFELSRARVLAFVGAAVFGLHPVCAEAVNYIVQRGDVWNALGVTASLLVYLHRPKPFGWHLGPMLLSCFAKPAAVMYSPILGAHAYFSSPKPGVVQRIIYMFKQAWPSIIVVVAFFLMHHKLEGSNVEPGGADKWAYWRTQPFMLAYEIKCFFLPTTLTADTDMSTVEWASWEFALGIGLVLGMIVAMFRLGPSPRTRPIAVGFAWFLLANLPTSVLPLAEITNDHRMLFPYVGLVLSFTTMAGFLYGKLLQSTREQAKAIAAAVLAAAFVLEAIGTVERNRVWDSEESLWKDVTIKSPKNGRGLMNYGLTLMAKGDLKGALDIYEKAHPLIPNYAYLETNMGIVKGALGGMDDQADRHFRRAIALIREPVAHPYFARYLVQRGRFFEARNVLREGLARQADHWPIRVALLDVLDRMGAYGELKRLLEETRSIFPGRPELNRFQNALGTAATRKKQLEMGTSLNLDERCQLAELCYGFGEADAALQTATAIITESSNAWCGHRMAAYALADMQRWSDVVHHADLALGMPGGDPNQRTALDQLRQEARTRQQ